MQAHQREGWKGQLTNPRSRSDEHSLGLLQLQSVCVCTAVHSKWFPIVQPQGSLVVVASNTPPPQSKSQRQVHLGPRHGFAIELC